LLFVHAHPDDETTTTGATIARYTARGIPVTLVTCTRGERGVNLLAGEGHQGTDSDASAEALAAVRVAELRAAADALGLADSRFLGGPGAWWDSGMADERVSHPRAFSDGDLAEQVGQLVAVIRETRPQVVVTYDERGGYGHPDHIRTHDVTVAAFDAAADGSAYPSAGEPWPADKLYAAVLPHSQLRSAIRVLAHADVSGANPFAGVDESVPLDALPFGVRDEAVTARVDGRGTLDAKVAAMRAHRTQMDPHGWFFVLADAPGRDFGVESFRILRGEPGQDAEGAAEDDLFSGLVEAERSATA
jgi:N-acetyl-1-D-myo-inositol-2-amino-2-deoxy-alpha-D-glucopyranoside deacetylase